MLDPSDPPLRIFFCLILGIVPMSVIQPTYTLIPAPQTIWMRVWLPPPPQQQHHHAQQHQPPPFTTVYVGSINDKATNDLIKSLLQKCGNVLNWRRLRGSNQKFQAFGFCDFEHPESTLRALRLLHDWPLGDKRLVVSLEKTFLVKTWAIWGS